MVVACSEQMERTVVVLVVAVVEHLTTMTAEVYRSRAEEDSHPNWDSTTFVSCEKFQQRRKYLSLSLSLTLSLYCSFL